ncbi:GGDEF domain-containing protein [Shewanella eurypsychrophilus]|uniref:diguanylate cyclase n=1 Tax=Shewanella eurypsychrophilus TaxID=2593656 RepID=A0ABX6VAI1_9GAMM|nr:MULTISPECIES: GGDEF domain-containing protein [Shewanella]QFU23664.1 diguanylate cyclase [Shewanella sp. YLB-09]QPG58886.1 GGDEF domain-containing protein [Shewanella eurypsychrophilus]
MDFGLATDFYSDEPRYQPDLLGSGTQELDLVQIIQQLHESLDPRTVFACFGKIMGQHLPIAGIKLRYNKYQFSWGRNQGLVIKQELVYEEKIARLEYSLTSPLMPSQAKQLQQLQTLVILPLFNATQFQDMSQQAMYDSLTRLGNRHYYIESLKKAIATSSRHNNALSIVILDLDNFKTLNDVYGHQFGDNILSEFGSVLTKAIRDTDQAFRVGGDEFVVLVRGDLSAAEILCQRILSTMSTLPLFNKYQVQTSLGISQWKHDEAATSLYERADKALYRAKAAGRRCFRSDKS